VTTKSSELLIFKCALHPHEVSALQKYLPAEEYCLINVPEQNTFYGIMNEELHSRFMDILSGETLECLEYLDEGEFKKFAKAPDREVIGNAALINKLSF
jgi:hypothetical protein